MCPYNKICAAGIAGVILAHVIYCSFEENCEYVQREPEIPEKTIPHFNMPKNAVAMVSGSHIEVDPSWGELIRKLEDGRSLYYIKPQEVEEIGHVTIVNTDGSKTIIDLTNIGNGGPSI